MKIPWSRFLAAYALFLAATGYLAMHQETAHPLSQPLAAFPAQLGEWHSVRQEYFSQALLSVLRPSDYLFRRYQSPKGQIVDIYIGYHDGAQGAGPIHSPKNCLPGNGWTEIFSRPSALDIGKDRVHLTEALYRQDAQQTLFLYWFMVRDRTLSSEIGLKLAEIANSVRNGQRGACFVRVSLPVETDPSESAVTAESFLKQAYPTLRAFLSS